MERRGTGGKTADGYGLPMSIVFNDPGYTVFIANRFLVLVLNRNF